MEDSATCQERAALFLARAEKEELLHVRQKLVLSAQGWIKLGRRASAVEARRQKGIGMAPSPGSGSSSPAV